MTTETRLSHYRREVAALGWSRWINFKFQSLRARRAPKGTTFALSVPMQPHPLHFRAGTTDLKVFQQNIVAHEYRCLEDVVQPGLIIDCGANVGYAASYFLARHPGAHLIAVEPEDGNFAVLARNLQPYRDRSTLVHSGVWSKEAGLVVSEEQMGAGGEWGVMVREARPGEHATMQAVDIGGLLARSGHERISILKIDVEGAEEVIFADRPEWLSKVDNLVIELHNDACERAFYRAIEGEGFTVTRCDELHVCKRPRH